MPNTNIFQISQMKPSAVLLFGISVVVIIVLKGLALWHAVKRDEKWWFAILLVVNTFGILDLVYLIFFAKIRFDKLFKK